MEPDGPRQNRGVPQVGDAARIGPSAPRAFGTLP